MVESASCIVKWFCIGGISLGDISRETHQVIATVTNRIGMKSNSGEGDEVIIIFYILYFLIPFARPHFLTLLTDTLLHCHILKVFKTEILLRVPSNRLHWGGSV
ncbi:putative glutamate synthase (ferredoxin) [Helianthus annuus]|uniref:Glutamate synthase (Ferredoxin) n=1 Tax=Helianthus annuus TaxID=4232 RepID=A0A251VKN4_HELAN|nr:putative glutamate synthase (ferredoxin) [Helianthus annuus]